MMCDCQSCLRYGERGWENGVLAPIESRMGCDCWPGGKKASLLDNPGNQGNLQIELEPTCLHRWLSASIGEQPCLATCFAFRAVDI